MLLMERLLVGEARIMVVKVYCLCAPPGEGEVWLGSQWNLPSGMKNGTASQYDVALAMTFAVCSAN